MKVKLLKKNLFAWQQVQIAVEGDVVNGMMQAGQSLTVLQKVEPVATIIEDIMKQARETLSAAATIKL